MGFRSDFGFPTIVWAGKKWGVRERNDLIAWGGPQAPDPDDGDGKWVQGATVTPTGELVLRNDGIRGGVEVHLVESTGYGIYRFVYSADFNSMDPHNVLGVFTYDMAEMVLNAETEQHTNGDGHTEIDFIEVSRWGDEQRALPHGGVTYYPDDADSVEPERYNPCEFDIPRGFQRLTTVAEWRQDYLRVLTTTADGAVLADVSATERIPRDLGTQQVRINLWTTSANPAHTNAQGNEVIFNEFSFTPPKGLKNRRPQQCPKSRHI